MRLLAILPLLALGSCTALPPDDTLLSPDASFVESPEAGVMIPDPCETGALPDRFVVSEGGKIELALAPPRGVTLELDVPEGWRIDRTDTTHASIRVPYASSGISTIEVQAICASPPATVSITVDVHPLAWSSVATWNSQIEGPKPRQFASLWFDQNRPGRLLVAGGAGMSSFDDLWSFDVADSKWELLMQHSTVAFGEASPIAKIPGEPAAYFIDALSGWTGSGTTFTLLRLDYGDELTGVSTVSATSAPPAAAEAGSFVYDAANDRYVSACGFVDGTLSCDVSIFDPASASWTEPSVLPDDDSNAPDARYNFAFGYDEANARLILFSGGREPSATNPVNPAQDTWALELGESMPRWRKLAGDQPPGRRNSCAVVDPIGHRMFVWGGTPDRMNVSDGLWVLDLDRGFEAWTKLELAGAPPPRSGCAATYDAANQRLIFGFGNTRAAIYTDLHALAL